MLLNFEIKRFDDIMRGKYGDDDERDYQERLQREEDEYERFREMEYEREANK